MHPHSLTKFRPKLFIFAHSKAIKGKSLRDFYFYRPICSHINFCPFTVYIDVITVNKQSLICNLERYFPTLETVTIVPVCHLYTESSIFLLRLGIKRWSNGLDSFFLKMELVVYCDNTSHNGDWRLVKLTGYKGVLVFLLHLFSHFLDSAVLDTFTRLEKISCHNLKLFLFILFIILVLILIKVDIAGY